MSRPAFNQDFLDLLDELSDAGADYVIVGAHALAVHGVPRATGDLDIFVRPSNANAERVLRALERFGAPVDSHHLSAADLLRAGTIYQIGLPPGASTSSPRSTAAPSTRRGAAGPKWSSTIGRGRFWAART